MALIKTTGRSKSRRYFIEGVKYDRTRLAPEKNTQQWKASSKYVNSPQTLILIAIKTNYGSM
jgi:hypothetical protein